MAALPCCCANLALASISNRGAHVPGVRTRAPRNLCHQALMSASGDTDVRAWALPITNLTPRRVQTKRSIQPDPMRCPGWLQQPKAAPGGVGGPQPGRPHKKQALHRLSNRPVIGHDRNIWNWNAGVKSQGWETHRNVRNLSSCILSRSGPDAVSRDCHGQAVEAVCSHLWKVDGETGLLVFR